MPEAKNVPEAVLLSQNVEHLEFRPHRLTLCNQLYQQERQQRSLLMMIRLEHRLIC
jgi:hypothetical protein